MKSSSQLFPVELVSAEIRDSVYQDVYSLKPNRSSDKSVEVALLHLHNAPDVQHAPQVLFVHDIFQSHWQWMDGSGYEEMIAHLIDQGVSVWLMDWRARGSSKMNRQPKLNRMQEMAKHDFSAVIDFIRENSIGKCTVVAQGFGAQMVQRAATNLKLVQRLVFVDGESLLPSKKYWIPGYRLLKLVRLMGKEWVQGSGSEVESSELLKELLLESGLFGRRNIVPRQQALTEMKNRSDHFVWLCTSRLSERRARRVLKKEAIIKRVKKTDVSSVILQEL